MFFTPYYTQNPTNVQYGMVSAIMNEHAYVNAYNSYGIRRDYATPYYQLFTAEWGWDQSNWYRIMQTGNYDYGNDTYPFKSYCVFTPLSQLLKITLLMDRFKYIYKRGESSDGSHGSTKYRVILLIIN